MSDEEITSSGPEDARRKPSALTRTLTGAYSTFCRPVFHTGSWWARQSGRASAQSLDERWGKAETSLASLHNHDPIWIHAASMGEVRIAVLFAERLAARSTASFVSVVTETGYNLGRELAGDSIPIIHAPFDLPKPIKRICETVNPRALAIVETEWWPNLLTVTRRHGIPSYAINGRLSPGSYRRYYLGRAYWRSILQAVDRFFMRSEDDASRLQKLGIPSDKIDITGSLKARLDAPVPVSPEVVDLLNPDGAPVILAGSTRPGEERMLLDAYKRLRTTIPDLRLWLAPRHPKRFREVSRLLRKSKLAWCGLECEPNCRNTDLNTRIALIDRMGLLASLYGISTVAFVGGSLYPFGGHNPLEPVAAGVPAVFGPHMESQSPLADQLIENGLSRVAHDVPSLTQAIRYYLDHSVDDEWLRQRDAFFRQLDGLADRVCEQLLARLDHWHQATH